MNHTPVPWRAQQDIVNWVICAPNQSHGLATVHEEVGNAEPDARFIVQACNSHAQLLEALQAMMARVNSLPLDLEVPIPQALAFIAARNKVDAAIKAAGG